MSTRILPLRRRSVQRVANSSTFHSRGKNARITHVDKPSPYASLVYVITQYILNIPKVEFKLRPRQRLQLLGEEGFEIDAGNLSSGDEDEGPMTADMDSAEEMKFLDSVEPIWDKGEGGRDLAFGRRKIEFFDHVTSQHRHLARGLLKKLLAAEQSIPKSVTQQMIHDELVAISPENVLSLSSALLTESLSASRLCSLEGLDKCYSGLVDAGRGLLSSGDGNNTNNIIHSITILFLTTLPKQTGDTLHMLGKLYALCGTARYRRRFVTRIAPLLLRPSNSALWSIQHRTDMELILSVTEVIFKQITGNVFGEKSWYTRGQSLREDEERQHTISLAASYLRSLHDSDPSGLTGNNSLITRQNGPHEMHEKLDMLIRGAIHGMSSGAVSYNVLGGHWAKKKAPLSPRVKLPLQQQTTHEVSASTTPLEQSPPAASNQLYPPAPLTPKPSHPSPHHTPRSPGSPPKSPFRKHHPSHQILKNAILDPEERGRTVMACRALREQINAYEKRFLQIYNRPPKKPADKAKLASTYAQYREWKKIIRSDAALRIQALGRGYLCRKRLITNDNNGKLTVLIRRNSLLNKKMNMSHPNVIDGVEVMMNGLPQTRQSTFATVQQKSVQNQPPPPDSAIFSNQTTNRPFSTSRTSSSSVPNSSSQLIMNPAPQRERRHRRQVSDSSEGSNDSSDASTASGRRSAALQDLQRQKRELKSQLKQYDYNFRRQHGRMPVKAEKEPIRHLYETYNALKVKISQIESDLNSVDGGLSVGTGSPSFGPRSVSPRSHPSPPLIINNTSPQNSPPVMLDMLRQEKGQLHQMLRSYERNFFQTHGRQVSSFEDIRPVAPQYRRYKEIKRTIGSLQDDERAFGIRIDPNGAV